jgi:hypothetical protein
VGGDLPMLDQVAYRWDRQSTEAAGKDQVAVPYPIWSETMLREVTEQTGAVRSGTDKTARALEITSAISR